VLTAGVSLRAVHRRDVSLALSLEEAQRLVTALIGAVETWRRHYEEDEGRTHSADEWELFRVENGVLIWRLEELTVLPGATVEHSQYAVRPPDDDDDGDAGVREPRRPRSPAPAAEERRG
jgi:hypothetical protein